MEFNPFDYDFHRNPYPTYAWLRENAPVYHNPTLDFWALSRFDDVLAGLHDTATYTSNKGVALEDAGVEGPARSMIHLDPPEHTQMRKLVARRFTPRRIAELEPRVRDWTRTLLDTLDGRTDFDVVSEYAALLPATVISTMLGIPPDQHDNVRVWTDELLGREAGVMTMPRDAEVAIGNLAGLSFQIMTLRRERPTDDILSLLVDVELDGQKLTDEQIIGFCILLISGGHETTAKLIAHGVRLFASHPDQRDAVIADPALMAPAVEELLRYTSPTQYMTRTTTCDVELHDTLIPENSKVALLLGSGNRDPREFERPDDFDIHRGNPRILAFGHGAHVCLGAAVARLEARVALEEFLARFPCYDVDEDAIEYMHSGNVQGPTKVPVTVRSLHADERNSASPILSPRPLGERESHRRFS
jgi:cytochrome P450